MGFLPILQSTSALPQLSGDRSGSKPTQAMERSLSRKIKYCGRHKSPQ
ncbi:hypothetical protein S7335_253 [Synechococcus sp. PCC 7335]|nr:hypothetical protein [Synechococcus sp. PCC 7335]EDX82944.1 hypothetical protein S7335_122 [Synechococcus sp. PCC 7335]EDX83075.1 hypothetical protein S7335_253 [Synechococcus sp. PCC 7335]